MNGLRVSSILLGVLTDKLAAIVLIGLLLRGLGAMSPLFQGAALITGALCTTLGAFVAARHSKQRLLAHGVAVGAVGLIISVLRFALTPVLAPSDSSVAHSIPWELAAWSSVVAAGFAGGLLATRSVRSRAA